MTLRITIEIVPHGDERYKRTLRVVNVSNTGRTRDEKVPTDWRHYDYVVKIDGGRKAGCIHCHNSDDGATELARRALALVVKLDREQGSVL